MGLKSYSEADIDKAAGLAPLFAKTESVKSVSGTEPAVPAVPNEVPVDVVGAAEETPKQGNPLPNSNHIKHLLMYRHL
jgi:hypothetical protein